MASRASVPVNGPAKGLGCQVTRFVCQLCTETGHLSSQGLFLGLATVLCHMTVSKPSFAAKLGFQEIRVDVLTSDVMAGARGTVGPGDRRQTQATR